MRFLIGVTDVSGIYTAYKSGFDAIGAKSDFITFTDSRYFSHTNPSILANIIKYCLKVSKDGNWVLKYPITCVGGVACVLFLLRAIVMYNVFIFSYTTSLLPGNRDLPILKLFGKKIIWIFHGSDIRPQFMDGVAIYDYNCTSVSLMVADAEESKRRARYIEKYADLVVAQPCHSIFLTKPFMNSVYLGVPVIDEAGHSKCGDYRDKDTLRVFHAPSEPYAKGTFKLREYIDEINGELKLVGKRIEYVEKTGVPHQDIISEIKQADVVFDQLYSDLVMPVFTCEAMMVGTPSIVCGYVKQYPDVYPKITPVGDIVDPPITYISPTKDEIRRELCKFFDGKYREASELKARDVYLVRCEPKKLASAFVTFAQNWRSELAWDFSKLYPNMICDPNSIVYYHGCGIDEDRLRRILARVRMIRPDFVFGDTRPELVEAINSWLDE